MVFQKVVKRLDHERILVMNPRNGNRYPVMANENMKARKGQIVEVEFLEAGPAVKMEIKEKGVFVTCTECGEEVNEKRVEMLGIEEDLLGKDVVLFICPVCNSEVRSHRRG